ncbi:MASE1 domain-containing protein [Bordetella sp. 15P40C-2]|uniref:MASE1 domain-containing protein n=1 Tax=Bordetella sp. 15P40C-2 TaxID=2572246 RepID=UPI0013207826|nr:MASE1 domain-containing protein [Bordetella sp. 15P40C-2]MVW72536.1 PAS domain-containing protein [Bordetella sp. 15P40C-2]
MNDTRALRILLFVSVYGALAFYCMTLLDPRGYSNMLWPAGGIAFGTLMVSRRREWPMWILLAGALHFAAGLISDRPISVSALYSVVDMIALPCGAALWRWGVKHRAEGLATPRNLVWFFGAIVVSGVVGLCLCIGGLTLAGFTPTTSWAVWTVAEMVGCLVGAPLVVTWSRFQPKISGDASLRRFSMGAVWLALLVVTATIAFDGPTAIAVLGSARYELSYLPLLFVVLLALTWNQSGATVGILILALIAIEQTNQGEGPFGIMNTYRDTSLIEAQVYIGAAAILGLIMSALIAHSRKAYDAMHARSVEIEAALVGSQHLMYVYDPAAGTLSWEGDVETVLGIPRASIQTLDSLMARVHEADRPALQTALQERLSNPLAPIVLPVERYRFADADGDWITISHVGSAIADSNNSVYRVAGLISRVTESHDRRQDR